MERIIWRSLDVVQGKLQMDSAYRASPVACQLSDKVNLIRGLPTDITERRTAADAAPADFSKLSLPEKMAFTNLN
jgi:hypothetical protein